MALVLIDVDGTLLTGASSERRLIRRLAARGRIGPVQLAACLGFALRHAPRYGRHVWKKNKAYLARLAVADVAAQAAELVQDVLLPDLRPGLLRRLEHHRAAGDTLALLTGAPSFIADPLARALDIEHCIATRCAVRGGRFTAAPPLRHPFREEKAQLAATLCRELGVRLEHAVAYADSVDDAPLLARVGHAVAVDPDRELAGCAAARGWEVLGA